MKNKSQGFTLVELLTVIAIIGILSSVVFVSLNVAKSRAKEALAKSEVHQISLAIKQFSNDTNLWPGREAAAGEPDPQPSDTVRCDTENNEVHDLNDAQVGLREFDENYPGWAGPYFADAIPLDPWGNNYFFDTDYDQPPTGDGTWAAVIGSFGPDSIEGNEDDIIEVVIEAPCP